MRVLILTPNVKTVGGVQRYSKALIEAFEEIMGTDSVSVVALPDAQPRGKRLRMVWYVKLWFACRAVWKAAILRPDLIVCCHVGIAPVGCLVGKLIRRPYWVIAYGIDVWCRLSKSKQEALRQAEKILSLSDFTGRQVVQLHGVAGERTVTLAPCISQKDWSNIYATGDALNVLGLDRCPFILTVARLAASERYKGHDVVLASLPKVIERVPNLKYLVVGDGDDRPRLQELARDMKLENHIVFAGEIRDDSVLAAYYQACDVFVLPARTVIDERYPKGEGFGIVFLEAMTFGKPVVGPNHGAPMELIQHGKTGLLVDPEDPASVADALLSLLTEPELARKMGDAGSSWVAQHYSFDAFRDRLREILTASTAPSQ